MNFPRLIPTAAVCLLLAAGSLVWWLIRTDPAVEGRERALGLASRPVSWKAPFPEGVALTPEGSLRCTIKAAADGINKLTQPGHEPRLTLAVVPRPQTDCPAFALHGQIRCTEVAGTGYLEMWTHYLSGLDGKGPHAQYFSRTMGTGGLMSSLTGNQDWHEIWLPFDATGASVRPDSFELNLCLPGQGTVELRNLIFTEYQSQAAMYAVMAGQPELAVSASEARRPLRAILWTTAALAIAAAAFLIGLSLRRRRIERELRRMLAMDAGGG